MKSFLNLLAASTLVLSSAACSSNGGGSDADAGEVKEFSVSACPFLEGRYQSGDMSITIKESRFADSYRLVMGEGASEIIVDGKSHPISAQASYQGVCADGAVEILGKASGQNQKMRLYFNSAKQLVQEITTSKVETTVWDKK